MKLKLVDKLAIEYRGEKLAGGIIALYRTEIWRLIVRQDFYIHPARTTGVLRLAPVQDLELLSAKRSDLVAYLDILLCI